MARRDLPEAGLAGDAGGGLFMRGITVTMHEADGDSADACRMGGGKGAADAFLVEGNEHLALRAHALVRLGDAFEQHAGLLDPQTEKMRPVLIADAQRVGKAPRGQKKRAFALAFEQCVCRHGRAHLDRADEMCRQGCAGRRAEQAADALKGRVLIMLRVLRQQLARDQPPAGRAGHDVREGAATVDPEIPAGVSGRRFAHGFVHRGKLPQEGRGRNRSSSHPYL